MELNYQKVLRNSLYLFIYLVWPHSMWDLNSLVRDQTYTPAAEVQSLNR